MLAGETICIYVTGVTINTVFGAGPDSTYNSVVSSDGNLLYLVLEQQVLQVLEIMLVQLLMTLVEV
jgi:hypothetical protein